MRNLKLTIEYDGTNYCGWQRQNSPRSTVHSPRLKTIQGAIEKTLQRIFKEKVKLIGAGRTDSGVHALGQAANFKTDSKIPLKNLQKALNSLLPRDIAIKRIDEASLDFHSQYSVKSKLYCYAILNRPYHSALQRNQVYFIPRPLDIKSMQRQARFLKGRHDFKSFQAADKKERSSLRTIKDIRISRHGGYIYIAIEADGFLYNMARNIAGTLIQIGLGKPFNIKEILKARDRRLAGPTAPARGLCLVKVKY